MFTLGRQKKIRINLKNILFFIVVPGVLILYFISTEKAFIQAFQEEFPIMGPGEYVFVFVHTMLVYFLAPILWILNFFIFFRFIFARSITYNLQVELLTILSNFSYGILLFMIVGRLLFE